MKQHYFGSIRRALYGESLTVAREIFEQRKREMTEKQVEEAKKILNKREKEYSHRAITKKDLQDAKYIQDAFEDAVNRQKKAYGSSVRKEKGT